MSRPGNRRGAGLPPRGTPGNRVPGALLLPQVTQAAVASAQVEQASTAAAIGNEVGALETLTDGLDVADIGGKLQDLNERLEALEP